MATETETALKQLSNPTLDLYLDLMASTETPAIMHAWSLISAASACLTRRKWFQMGAIRIYPCQYVMLVGPPGTRKSAGISFAKKLVDEIEGLRFGPNNTAGRPQGLISAMQGSRSAHEAEEDAAFQDALGSAGAAMDFGMGSVALEDCHALDKHAIYCPESELVGFLGRNMDEFITFLGDVWDCPDRHTTTLKRETTAVDYPCLNFIGGITPLHITTYLPPQSIGQGFTSRVLMVYEDESKKIAWPEPIDEEILGQFKQLMRWIFNMESGAFSYEPDVREKVEALYTYELPTTDVRFLHYAQRRQTHMIKVAMALCALRQSDTVSADDIQDAHDLLALTEKRMVEALGEYGMSEAAVARARVQHVLKAATQPLTAMRITLSCGSDVKRQEVQRAIFEMEQNGQIIQVHLRDVQGVETVGYAWPRDSNPFEKFQKVEVDYLLTDAPAKQGKQNDTKAEALEALRGKQKGPDADALAAAAAEDQKGPARETESGRTGLLAQGYSTVQDKLNAFIKSRN